MRNVFIIIKHEIQTTLRKRSFWITTFLLPGVIIALSAGSQALSRSSIAQDGSNPLFGSVTGGTADVGYVDQAGVIKQLPDQLPASVKPLKGQLRAYPDQAQAQAALDAGQLNKYYLIPADFIKTGNLILVDSKFSLFNSLDNNDYFEYLIRFNLTGDSTLAIALFDPTGHVESHGLAPQAAPNNDSGAAFTVPFAALFIFFFVITMTSGFMLQSVTKEKENRTVEILLVSLRPRELMSGKILGLGLVALLQVVIWAGGGLLILKSNPLSGVTLPDGFLAWALLYFILGYLLYASILGALGALVPSAREGAQFTFIVMLPLMLPLWLSNIIIESPNEPVSVFFSLFPLTSPTSMITRLAAGPVPLIQIIVGLIGLAITAYLFVLLSARFFRADTLLSSSSLNLRRIAQGLRR